MPIPPDASLADVLMSYLRDADASWSCGSFGALAEFMRSADEPVWLGRANRIAAVTARGAISIAPTPDVRLIAYELTSSDPDLWQHGVALCLAVEDCAMSGRTVLTELGPDRDALRPEDREAILFDLGLGVRQADICVRSDDARTIALLRAGVGRPFLAADNTLGAEIAAMSPHRVFRCRFGRSPDGPHTHVLPKLLAQGMTHAANLPLPDGWVPCMTLFSAHPLRDREGRRKPFDAGAFDAFEALWSRFGDPALRATKSAALAAARAGRSFAAPETRAGRMVAEVALRQAIWFERVGRAGTLAG